MVIVEGFAQRPPARGARAIVPAGGRAAGRGGRRTGREGGEGWDGGWVARGCCAARCARHCTAAHAPRRMRMLATRGCVIKHPDWEGDADSATKRLALLTRWGGVNATHAECARLGGLLAVAPPRPLAIGGGSDGEGCTTGGLPVTGYQSYPRTSLRMRSPTPIGNCRRKARWIMGHRDRGF